MRTAPRRPELLQDEVSANRDRANKALRYLAELRVNGHPASLGASGPTPCRYAFSLCSYFPPLFEKRLT